MVCVLDNKPLAFSHLSLSRSHSLLIISTLRAVHSSCITVYCHSFTYLNDVASLPLLPSSLLLLASHTSLCRLGSRPGTRRRTRLTVAANVVTAACCLQTPHTQRGCCLLRLLLVPIFQSRHRTSQQPPLQVSAELSSPTAWPLHGRSRSLTSKMAAAAWRCHDNCALRSLYTHVCVGALSVTSHALSQIWFAEGSRFHAIGFRRRHFETERRKEIRKYFNAKIK